VKFVHSRHTIYTGLYWICAGVAVFTFGHFAEKSEQQPYPGEPSQEMLSASFHEATSSVGGTLTGDAGRFHRGQAVGLRAMVVSPYALGQSMARIDETMSRLGWNRIEKKVNNRGSVYLKFCKRRIAAIFEANDAPSEPRLHVSVVWSDSQKHYAYCAK